MAYPWARVIDDGYLTEYSAKVNFHLCVIFAGILEIAQDNSGIWEANWVKTRLAEVEELKYISQAFCEKYSIKLQDLKATTKSKGILEQAQAIKIRVSGRSRAPSINEDDC